MKIGIQLPEVEREVGWTEIREVALAAEDCGMDSIWVGDHLLYRDDTGARGPWEAWSLLAALSEVTRRVELGPLVAATSFHNPAMIAKKAATVDEISGGRLVLGLGAGWNKVEYEAFGYPFDQRVSRFEEAFQIITTLIRVGSIDHVGRFHEMRELVLSPPARHDMKLMIGSNGPRMLRIAVPHVDMWNSWYASYGNRVEGLPPLLENLESACRDMGRDPDAIERTVAIQVALSRGEGRRAGSGERPAVEPITGSDSKIAEALSGFESAGIDHVQVVLDPIDTSAVEEFAGIVDLFRA